MWLASTLIQPQGKSSGLCGWAAGIKYGAMKLWRYGLVVLGLGKGRDPFLSSFLTGMLLRLERFA